MANLSDNDRRDVWADLMADISRDRESISISKTELRAAVDAIDAWMSTNAASLNAAIPQPARGALSASAKARLLTAIVRKRYVQGA